MRSRGFHYNCYLNDAIPVTSLFIVMYPIKMLAKVTCGFSPWKVGRIKPKNVGVVVPTRRLEHEVHQSAKFVRNDDDRSLTMVVARGIEMSHLPFSTVRVRVRIRIRVKI